MKAPAISPMALRIFEERYFTATIEVLRTTSERDADGDKIAGQETVIATFPGRIVRGRDPLEVNQAERVVSVKNWEARLSLAAIAAFERERGCFEIKTSDRLRDKDSGQVYEIDGDDTGRTEASYLSVFCAQVG